MNGTIHRLIFFIMKEHNYNIIMMLKCSGLNVLSGQNEGTRIVHGEAIKLNYPDFSGNYRYRGAVDNHNVLRDDGGTKSQTGL